MGIVGKHREGVERIFHALFVAGELGLSNQEIADMIYADRADGGPLYARSCVIYFVNRLRRYLAPHGATIVATQRTRGNRFKLVTPRRAA